jgi:ATP-dependent Clp protease ATP-binding subunit ClpC
VEKAAPYVFDLFLQAFGGGRLTDPASGRSVDLGNTLVIMTSNLGGTVKGRGIGFARGESRSAEERNRLLREVEGYFRPEFINRLDNIVVFRPLDRENMRQIARRELGRALQREGVIRRNILLDFREDVLEVLLAAGFSEAYGARPLKRAIDRLVLLPLARRIAAEPDLRDQLLEFQAPHGEIEIATIPLGPTLVTTPPKPEELPEDEEAEWEEQPQAGARLSVPPGLSLRQIEVGIGALRRRLEAHLGSEHFERLVTLKEELLEEMLEPSFWDDEERAHRVNRTVYHLDRITKRLLDLQRQAESFSLPVGTAQRDAGRVARLGARYRALEGETSLAELELLATDGMTVSTSGARIRILPLPSEGEPGSDDWPLVLLGLYEGWAQRHGYEVETEAGAGAIVTLRGGNLAGILAGETGVHKRRTLVQRGKERYPHVDLARVEVSPLLKEEPSWEDGKRDTAEVVRLYSFGRSHYVRDPRTGERSNRAREVLKGDIDSFLLAYLSQHAPERTVTA